MRARLVRSEESVRYEVELEGEVPLLLDLAHEVMRKLVADDNPDVVDSRSWVGEAERSSVARALKEWADSIEEVGVPANDSEHVRSRVAALRRAVELLS